MEQENYFIRRRGELKLSQYEIAKRADITDKAVSSWERGESLPSRKKWKAVAAAYEISTKRLAEEINKLTSEQFA